MSTKDLLNEMKTIKLRVDAPSRLPKWTSIRDQYIESNRFTLESERTGRGPVDMFTFMTVPKFMVPCYLGSEHVYPRKDDIREETTQSEEELKSDGVYVKNINGTGFMEVVTSGVSEWYQAQNGTYTSCEPPE